MKTLKHGLLLATLIATQTGWTCSKDGRDGILPHNNFYIGVNDQKAGGLTEDQFNGVIDEVEHLYAPIISQAGGLFKVERKWTDGTVNAYAQQFGTTWQVSMFGGLARHQTITRDGFSLVICHEIGHHLGGAPKYAGEDWASNEGQADYFSSTKCLRRVWNSEDNAAAIKTMTIPAALKATCTKKWHSDADRALCQRIGMAGDSVARLFADLMGEEPAKFETPDKQEVTATNDSHPATQCRLDTYFQASLCQKSFNEDFGKDEVKGACHGTTGQKIGLRPRCWFKPLVK